MLDKKLILIAILILVGAFATRAQRPSHLSADYELVWQDEFDGTVLDTSKWFYRALGTVRQFGIVRKENVLLDGEGHLIITATKEDSTYYCGQIGSRLDRPFKYGYFECRVKVNENYGPSTAFWLQSLTYGKYHGDPGRSGTEIDILEYRKKYHTDRLYNTIHWINKKGKHTQNSKIYKYPGVETGFHTYALEWTPKYYIFYVDGKKYWKTRASVSQAFQYIILSVELNGWSGNPAYGSFPDKAIYDYVRVYQKKL